jgi:Fe-S-cluster-containing hydrogenase component 2
MKSYEKTGILTKKDLKLPTKKQLKKGVVIIECIQEIPCDPCVASCPVNSIKMKDINAPPEIDYEKCIGCAKCVGICPGLAIFVVKILDNKKALVTLPYEFLPVPKKGDIVDGLNRIGEKIDEVTVKKVIKKGRTMVITVETEEKYAMDIRNIKVEK